MSLEFSPEQEKIINERIVESVYASVSYVLREMKEHFGEEAYQVIVNWRGKQILQQMRNKAEEKDNSIEAFIKDQWVPLPEQGYENKIDKTESGYQMHISKCPLHDLAKRHGITEEMFYLCCEGDPFVPEGFNPSIGFKRTKTLMQGDDCCDHFFYDKDKSKQS